jgi:prepilin-type N-terminal cleavage/methylation domain-containing protein
MKKAFTLIELLIIIAIIALLAAIAVPNFMKAKCIKNCNSGNCSDTCKKYLNPNSENNILNKYDMQDVEVFCSILGVSTYDFSRSQSLRVYYEQFKKGELNLKLNK